MKKNGFTLVELLAIIIILLAICAVSYPVLTKTLKKNNNLEFENYKENLCLAGKTYINSENIVLTNSDYIIDISKLIEYGIVDKDLIDPKNKDEVKYHKLIFKIANDNIECTYQ